MPGKRNRDGSPVAGQLAPVKPMSAIAAARLRAQQQAEAAAPIAPPSPIDVSVSSELEEELEEEIAEEIAIEPQPRNLQLCTWRYGKDYVSSESDEEVTVSLNKNTTITLIGCFDFVVRKGAVNINGANFGAKSRKNQGGLKRRAFVPSTHPITVIRGLDGDNEVQFLSCDEPMPFEKLSPLFADIWNAHTGKGRPRSFSLITETDADPLHRSIAPELVPEDWARTIEEIALTSSSTSTSTLLTGAPSTGKSIFASRLTNRYLTGLGKTAHPVPSVYYLDLDPNKPSYSPHGQISLVVVRTVDLGPNFTHPATIPNSLAENEVVKAHPVPVNGIALYEDHFLACASDLLRTYLTLRQRDPAIPLIVNTPGALYSAHLTTLLNLIRQLKPQRVVHLADLAISSTIGDEETTSKLAALTAAARKAPGSTLTQITACPPLTPPSRTDAERRAMGMMSFFHCTGVAPASADSPRHFTFSSLPLSHLAPWEFTYAPSTSSQPDIHTFLLLSEPVAASEIMTVLNGSIVHICITSSTTLPSIQRTEKYHIPYVPKDEDIAAVTPLSPTSSRLLCTALIRSFDPERGVVQVLVPKTHEILLQELQSTAEGKEKWKGVGKTKAKGTGEKEGGEKTVFVYGCCETPEWAYTEDAYHDAHSGVVQEAELPPWVERKDVLEGMGYMGVPRRVRKFQQ